VGCTGQYIVVYHSSTDPTVYAQDIQTNLQSHPGSKYLLTLESCSSLNQISNAGTMIYAVYGGPFDTLTQACVAASRFPGESYVKIMDGATAPDQAVRSCQ
jgi:serine/threonine-protein kinase